MPETYTQVCVFCRLAGHYWRFIKGFTNLVCPLYDVLGKEVKMGPVDLPPEVQEVVNILKGKVQSTPVLVFPDFDKPQCTVILVGQCHMVLNGVHHDAGHQGQQRTLALTQERFWWPMMAEDCRAIVRGCPCCRAFEGEVPMAPLCLIWVYAPLELVHLDYTSVESTMELNKPPMVKNVLMMMDHFVRYALVVVTKDQTAKTVAKVFYEHFIAVFGAPAKLLSDRGANFTSTLVEELCATFGIQKCRTTAYHAQCNGQVECFHQMLFHMIGKLAHDKKAQWEQHLPELLQAYNSTRSVVTSYSPHYLMFGRHPHLPVDYYFLTVSAFKHSHHMPTYVTEVRR